MKKKFHLKALKYTVTGLMISIIGQLFIGRSALISIPLTILGVIFAGYGVFLAFGLDKYFRG